MFALFRFVLAGLASSFKSKRRLEAENGVLPHQSFCGVRYAARLIVYRNDLKANRPMISFIPGHSRAVAGYRLQKEIRKVVVISF
jgi:hypothetical protein